MSLALDHSTSFSSSSAVMADGEEVLVVDSDARFRELVALRLESAGAEVYRAANVFEAIECLERRHVDLVICDYSLPSARGTDLLAYLRHRDLPVGFVLMSGALPADLAAEVWSQSALAISKGDLLRLL